MVECQICNKSMNAISWKHLIAHDLTVAQYKELFPDAPTRSEDSTSRKRESARQANASRVGIPRDLTTKLKISNTKQQANTPAWNKGIVRTESQNAQLSLTRKQKYVSGDLLHWNKDRSTPDSVKIKISSTLKAREQTYSSISKAKRKETIAQKIREGWVRRSTYEMTPEHMEAWMVGNSLRVAQLTLDAIARSQSICSDHDITINSVSNNSYLYHLSCNICGHCYSRTRNAFVASKVHNQAYICPVCHPRTRARSSAEVELFNFICQILPNNVSAVASDRSVLNGREIDCLIPELNLGFEYNGLYWHAEGVSGKSPNDHNWKTKLAFTKGVRLVTIFEDEWLHKREIVKSRITHLVKAKTQRVIYARNTIVKQISSPDKDNFLNAHHIQGTDRSGIRYGAWLGQELIAVMTITKTNMVKGGSGDQYELNRFAVACNTHIPGIASKLFAQFVNDYAPESVVSYSDRRWCTGQVYDQLGFAFVCVTPPSYWYLTDNYTRRTHRSAFMKHTLESKLSTFDPDISEWDNMRLNGYDRIWDCGTSKFIYHKQK